MILDLELSSGQRKTVCVLYIESISTTVWSLGSHPTEYLIDIRLPDGSFIRFLLSLESFLAVRKVFQNA